MQSNFSAGFVRVMENLESHGISEFHFSCLESHLSNVSVWVMETYVYLKKKIVRMKLVFLDCEENSKNVLKMKDDFQENGGI